MLLSRGFPEQACANAAVLVSDIQPQQVTGEVRRPPHNTLCSAGTVQCVSWRLCRQAIDGHGVATSSTAC